MFGQVGRTVLERAGFYSNIHNNNNNNSIPSTGGTGPLHEGFRDFLVRD